MLTRWMTKPRQVGDCLHLEQHSKGSATYGENRDARSDRRLNVRVCHRNRAWVRVPSQEHVPSNDTAVTGSPIPCSDMPSGARSAYGCVSYSTHAPPMGSCGGGGWEQGRSARTRESEREARIAKCYRYQCVRNIATYRCSVCKDKVARYFLVGRHVIGRPMDDVVVCLQMAPAALVHDALALVMLTSRYGAHVGGSAGGSV